MGETHRNCSKGGIFSSILSLVHESLYKRGASFSLILEHVREQFPVLRVKSKHISVHEVKKALSFGLKNGMLQKSPDGKYSMTPTMERELRRTMHGGDRVQRRSHRRIKKHRVRARPQTAGRRVYKERRKLGLRNTASIYRINFRRKKLRPRRDKRRFRNKSNAYTSDSGTDIGRRRRRRALARSRRRRSSAARMRRRRGDYSRKPRRERKRRRIHIEDDYPKPGKSFPEPVDLNHDVEGKAQKEMKTVTKENEGRSKQNVTIKEHSEEKDHSPKSKNNTNHEISRGILIRGEYENGWFGNHESSD